MLGKELLAYVDHTLLRPTATWDDIKEVCDAGVAYKTASVCIPPDFVASAHEAYPKLNICTVIGFPLGYETKEVKVAETKLLLVLAEVALVLKTFVYSRNISVLMYKLRLLAAFDPLQI